MADIAFEVLYVRRMNSLTVASKAEDILIGVFVYEVIDSDVAQFAPSSFVEEVNEVPYSKELPTFWAFDWKCSCVSKRIIYG